MIKEVNSRIWIHKNGVMGLKMTHPKWHVEYLAVAAIIIIFYYWFAWPLVWTASQNMRLINAFNVDEAGHVYIVKGALNQHSFRLMFNSYGHLYFNLALLPLFLIDSVSVMTEQKIIIVLRLISTMAAMAAIASVFLLAKRFFGSLSAWISSLSFMTVPLLFNEFSIISHPDILQVLFIVLSLYFTCHLVEKKDIKWLLFASVSAGLTFACKYSGIFLLIILWTIEAYNIFAGDRLKSEPEERKPLKTTDCLMPIIGLVAIFAGFVFTPGFVARHMTDDGQIMDIAKIHFITFARIACLFFGFAVILLKAGGFVPFLPKKTLRFIDNLYTLLFRSVFAFIVFSISFFITSPYSLSGLNFVSGIAFESEHTALGHMLIENHNKILWFKELTSPQLIGKFVYMIVLLQLFLSILAWFRNKNKRAWHPETVLWLWIFLYMGFLIFRINMIRSRYLLPVIPVCFILFSLPIKQLVEWVKVKLPHVGGTSVSACIVVLMGCLEFPNAFQRIYQFRKETLVREETNTSVKAGKWIEENYPASSRVLYDRFCYVPVLFTNAYATFDATLETLGTFNPDIVMVSKQASYPYDDIGNAKVLVRGEEYFWKRFEYYAGLRDGRAGYTLARDFGGVQVFRKR